MVRIKAKIMTLLTTCLAALVFLLSCYIFMLSLTNTSRKSLRYASFDTTTHRCTYSETNKLVESHYEATVPDSRLVPLEHKITVPEPMVPAVSIYRQRFLFWYHARPDIAASVGTDSGSGSSKYLIYRCDSDKMSYCGGWADRIKGIVASYVIANLTGRNFKIVWLTRGCDFNNYLMPHLVDWLASSSFRQSLDESYADTKMVNAMDSRKFYRYVSQTNFSELIGSRKFVYFKTNIDQSFGFQKTKIYGNDKLAWVKDLTGDEVFATVYKRLFILHPRLHFKLQEFLFKNLPTVDHKLICVHIRMGRNPTIPRDTEIRNSPQNLVKVWKFISNHSTTDFHKVFVMGDSEDTITQAKLQPFQQRLVTNDGPIVHLEISRSYNSSHFCEAEEKVVFDQHVLMNCDVLLISNSGLSRLAAYIRGSDQGLYCLMKDGDIVPCNRSTIIRLYHILS